MNSTFPKNSLFITSNNLVTAILIYQYLSSNTINPFFDETIYSDYTENYPLFEASIILAGIWNTKIF